MGVRKLKPVTPGQRFKVANDFANVTKTDGPEKSLVKGRSKSGGSCQSTSGLAKSKAPGFFSNNPK